jgi:four helix bundle protein
MNNRELTERTTLFALQCVKITQQFPNTRLGNHIQGQLIRSATSLAANYRASRLAQSRAGFIAKLSIVIEEADESEFWLGFAKKLELLKEADAIPLKKEAYELASIFIASRRTLKNQTSKTAK